MSALPKADPASDPLELLTAEEIAKLFHVPVSWVRSAARSCTKTPLPHFKIGHYVRFRESEVRAWLESRKRTFPRARR